MPNVLLHTSSQRRSAFFFAAVEASLDSIVLWTMVQVTQSWQQLISPFLKPQYLAKKLLEGRSLCLLHSLMGSALSQPAGDHGLLQPRRAHLCLAADSISVACLQCLQQHDACKSTKKPLFRVSSDAAQHLSLATAAAEQACQCKAGMLFCLNQGSLADSDCSLARN